MSKDKKKNLTMFNQTLYEVEKVVSVRWVKNKQECLIKWKGYDESYNTWEPKEHITLFYKETPDQEKDDDPEYTENVPLPPSTPHQYHTRAKKRKPIEKTTDKSKIKVSVDKDEDEEIFSEEEEVQIPETPPIEYHPKKMANETTCEEIEIKKKGGELSPLLKVPKESLVNKIISLGWDETKFKQIGLVESHNKKILNIELDVLKARYPDKVIEYYEQQLRNNRSARYY